MNDVDFSTCRFIKENMYFYTYTDFCNASKRLKAMYDTLDENQRLFYKWYIYANIHMSEFFKNLIWNYLNNNEPEAFIELISNKKNYRAK